MQFSSLDSYAIRQRGAEGKVPTSPIVAGRGQRRQEVSQGDSGCRLPSGCSSQPWSPGSVSDLLLFCLALGWYLLLRGSCDRFRNDGCRSYLGVGRGCLYPRRMDDRCCSYHPTPLPRPTGRSQTCFLSRREPGRLWSSAPDLCA